MFSKPFPIDLAYCTLGLTAAGEVVSVCRMNLLQALWQSSPPNLVYHRDGRIVDIFREPGAVHPGDIVRNLNKAIDEGQELPNDIALNAAHTLLELEVGDEATWLFSQRQLTQAKLAEIISKFVKRHPALARFEGGLLRWYRLMVTEDAEDEL